MATILTRKYYYHYVPSFYRQVELVNIQTQPINSVSFTHKIHTLVIGSRSTQEMEPHAGSSWFVPMSLADKICSISLPKIVRLSHNNNNNNNK